MVTLRCLLSDQEGTIQYNWTNKQGTLIVRDSLSGNLTLQAVKKTEAGPYTCTAGNVAGSTQRSITLSVLCEFLFKPSYNFCSWLPKV